MNNPAELDKVLAVLGGIQAEFNGKGGAQISMADLIVLAGSAAVEAAAKAAGHDVTVPFTPGRGDATQEQTDVESYAVLEPKADAFRNYYGPMADREAQDLMIDQSALLGLTIPQMTVLIGGMRAMGATYGDSAHGVLTDTPGALDNAFFRNVLSMDTLWEQSDSGVLEGKDRATGAPKWTATIVDLVYGSNAQLRAIAEVYAADDNAAGMVDDFIAAWVKVMENDRFDLHR